MHCFSHRPSGLQPAGSRACNFAPRSQGPAATSANPVRFGNSCAPKVRGAGPAPPAAQTGATAYNS